MSTKEIIDKLQEVRTEGLASPRTFELLELIVARLEGPWAVQEVPTAKQHKSSGSMPATGARPGDVIRGSACPVCGRRRRERGECKADFHTLGDSQSLAGQAKELFASSVEKLDEKK